MKKLLLLVFCQLLIMNYSCSKKETNGLILIEGGLFTNTKSNYYNKKITVPSFYMGTKEVTQKEWEQIMNYNPSFFKGSSLPVETVNWYECIEYCNKRSIKEKLDPYYIIDKEHKDVKNDDQDDFLKWTISINEEANGYRLPTITEWEFAASGGTISKNYLYSGSNNPETVAWYWCNSGDKNLKNHNWNWNTIENNNCTTKPTGQKPANELGLHDMSGNVREWCWEWESDYQETKGRAWKGGCWFGGEFTCATSYLQYYNASAKCMDQGFRVCRNY